MRMRVLGSGTGFAINSVWANQERPLPSPVNFRVANLTDQMTWNVLMLIVDLKPLNPDDYIFLNS